MYSLLVEVDDEDMMRDDGLVDDEVDDIQKLNWLMLLLRDKIFLLVLGQVGRQLLLILLLKVVMEVLLLLDL
jgi:asparagine synthetase A